MTGLEQCTNDMRENWSQGEKLNPLRSRYLSSLRELLSPHIFIAQTAVLGLCLIPLRPIKQMSDYTECIIITTWRIAWPSC